MSISIVRSSLI